MQGFGTEKIEEEIALYFPEARVARMDLDSTRRRKSYEQIIARFELHESDILVGTQMVSKGLDFEHVRLVGIVNADTMLNYPDFRAHERSYQLMAQVSGRAGRKGKRGLVIIQTSDHQHPVIEKVVQNDFRGLYRSQLEERRKFQYPPFCRLIEITLRHRERDLLDKAAEFLAQRLKQYTSEKILGPEYPLVSRIQNLYLKTLLVKTEKSASLPSVKNQIIFLLSELSEHPMFRSVTHVVDVDPY
jgi:primosomal protein N' (replication factor Y)